MSDGDANRDESEGVQRGAGRLRGTPALRAHFTLSLGLALCVAAFWFEIGRAEGGNELSWAYVFEWPLLAVFAVYMWWKVLHPDSDNVASSKRAKPAIAPEFSGMLSAWQDHQRELAETQRSVTTELADERDGAGE